MGKLIAIAACSLVAAAAVSGQNKPAAKKTFELSLKPVHSEKKAETNPVFMLTIRNVASTTQRVPDMRKRPDLEDTYYQLEVFKEGKQVFVPHAIDDPEPITDKDWLALAPGTSVSVGLSNSASAWYELPPGSYKARVRFRFWQNLHEDVYSPKAAFVVKP
jgi:hypothetical protein